MGRISVNKAITKPVASLNVIPRIFPLKKKRRKERKREGRKEGKEKNKLCRALLWKDSFLKYKFTLFSYAMVCVFCGKVL